MSDFKIFVRWVVNIFTCLLLFILALVIYGKCSVMFGDNKYPNYMGYTFFQVASGSMEPTLYVNDVILIDIQNEKLKKDDIIAFENDGSIITHRIIHIDGDVITVKGDNNNVIDKPINREQVIGKVIKVFPKFGVWKEIVTEPKVLIFIFITLILFDFALSYKSDNKKDDNKVIKNKKDDEEVIAVPIEKHTNKDIIEANKLLELTRKIDIAEINNLLDNDNDIKLNSSEIKRLKKELSTSLEKTQEIPVLKPKEKKFIEYTMRLNLNEIQKKIKNNVK